MVALQAAIRPLPRQQQSHPPHQAPSRRALELERGALRAAAHGGGLLSPGHRPSRPLLPPAAFVATFRGQAALTPGASSGIGEALAREFARRGAALVLAARRTDRLDRLVAELTAGGARAVAVRCDVTVDGEPEQAAAAARERFGRLDVVIANAGFGVVGPFALLTLDDYRRQFETNVFGVLRTLKATLADVRRTRGRIAVIGSVSGHIATPGSSPYATREVVVTGHGKAAVFFQRHAPWLTSAVIRKFGVRSRGEPGR